MTTIPPQPLDDFLLFAERMVLPDGVAPAALHICEGVIRQITTSTTSTPARADLSFGSEYVVMPGIVDTHVHVNEPGRTEWEGIDTASRAAARGGVTSIVDMPLNSRPATTSVAALDQKLAAFAGHSFVDFGFWGGVIPGNQKELAPLSERGVLGFKCFLVDSGVPEFPAIGEVELRSAMHELAGLGKVLLVHAEHPDVISAALATAPKPSAVYRDYLASRPSRAEVQAIELMVRLSQETGCAVHIVHVASGDALPILTQARRAGVRITAECCPHYLTFDAEDISEGATQFKCAPPIREATQRERLWRALEAGEIDLIASDHSPSPPELKRLDEGDFFGAWGGISSLGLNLAAVWSQAVSRAISIEQVTRWLCEAPAQLAGLGYRKGRIAVGYDADLVVWRPNERFVVEPHHLEFRHPVSPYLGRELSGSIAATYLRGTPVYSTEASVRSVGEPRGEWLHHSSTSNPPT